MSKRKFADFKEQRASKPTAHNEVSIKHSRVYGVLDNGKTNLFRALKVARGFERQKLGRRQKNAKKDGADGDMARLEAETVALKALDLTRTAELHLYKTLLKIKSIASSASFPSNIKATVDAAAKPQSIASTNVQARLFNSVPVKTAMIEITNDVRNVMGIAEQPVNGKTRLRAKDDEKRKGKFGGINGRKLCPEEESEASWNGLRTSVSGDDTGNGLKNGDIEDNDYKAYNSRIAGSEDESTDSKDANRHTNSDWSGSENGSGPDPEYEASRELGGPESEKQIPNVHKTSKAASAAPKSTTFLPSLSMGGYWCGSDSGSSIDDTAGDIKVRRNKRGQRARRAIYEKKYGQNANHIKNQVINRDHGWDPRKGAQGKDPRRKGREGRRRDHVQGFRTSNGYKKGVDKVVSSGANSDPVKPRVKGKTMAEGPLHPSWEAAKKAKEVKKSAPFQGKKITFD